ncbi:hypothetical protein HK105_205228 [Polyrhizophydium stewartii]|uniref:Uncharacterized protein n=1 Tax=Polyrhizophydium stewartii TaxID=2732419 RepID=A0ABR4N6M0_9FUNG
MPGPRAPSLAIITATTTAAASAAPAIASSELSPDDIEFEHAASDHGSHADADADSDADSDASPVHPPDSHDNDDHVADQDDDDDDDDEYADEEDQDDIKPVWAYAGFRHRDPAAVAACSASHRHDDEDFGYGSAESAPATVSPPRSFAEHAPEQIFQALLANVQPLMLHVDIDDLATMLAAPAHDSLTAILDALVRICDLYSTLVSCFIDDEDDQLFALFALERLRISVFARLPFFAKLVMVLFQLKLVELDAVVTWHDSCAPSKDPLDVRSPTCAFVQWFEGQDENDDKDKDIDPADSCLSINGLEAELLVPRLFIDNLVDCTKMLRTANADASTKDNANGDTSGSFPRPPADADSDHLRSVSPPDQGHDADAPANAEADADAASPGAAARRPPEHPQVVSTVASDAPESGCAEPPDQAARSCLEVATDSLRAASADAAFWRSQLASAPREPLSLGGPRTPPGLVPLPAPRTVPLPAAAGLSTSAVAVAAAATVAKFKCSSDAVVGIAVAGNDPAARTIVPVRIALDDSTTIADAVAAAAESICAATQHSPADLAQVRAWCGLSPSDPVCAVVLCIGKASNDSLEADLASIGAAIALAVDTSTGGGSVTSIHDGHWLDEDQAASIVGEFAFTVGHLVSALASQETIKSMLGSQVRGDEHIMVVDTTSVDKETMRTMSGSGDGMSLNQSDDYIGDAFQSSEVSLKPAASRGRHRRRKLDFAIDAGDQGAMDDFTLVKTKVAAIIGLDLEKSGTQSFTGSGGDSLAAIQLAAQMQQAGIALTAADLMSSTSIKEAVEKAAKRDKTMFHWPKAMLSFETIAELAVFGTFEDAYPATPLQAGMVAATMQDARAYANQVPLRATRTVSLESLCGALRAVVQHHAILRTSFASTVAGGIVQVVRASADAAECVAVAAPLAQHLAADKARGFSLADASWIRAALVCDPAGSAQHVVVTIHHALYDGWSLPMIMRDLVAALDGHALEPRPAFRTVVDFIAAQDAAATEAFWTQQLVGLEPAQPLSLGHSARTDDEDAPLAQACSTPMAELQRAAQRAGVTVAVVLKAAWAATLRKFTRSHDVVFGEVLANRDIAVGGADRIVGPLLNTVPRRVVLDDTARVADLVASLQAQYGAVLSHSHAALVDVQRWAGVDGDAKLFNTLFAFENIDMIVKQDRLDFVGSITNAMNRSTVALKQPASILAEFDFGVQQLVSALSDKATIESLWTLSSAQQAAIARFSHGERVPLPFSLVHHGFEARAKQHPDWRAVEHGDAHLSYGDLDACGCALAAALASHGVQRGSRVAVVMQRSIEFVVALVGVLKAGATIVPVDSSFPADRIQFMLDDASVCAIVTTASEAGRIAQLSVGDRAVVVADARALLASGVSFTPAAQHTATGDDDVFIVYTSGSTGKPKGVPVPHKGVVNVVAFRTSPVGQVEHARVMQFMAIGFDVCQWEVWGSLCCGATLVIRGSNVLETLRTVDAVIVTPTGLVHFGDSSQRSSIKHVAVIGESFTKELKDAWASTSVFVNSYGPSETAIMTHSLALLRGDEITVGSPMENTSSYVLDAQGRQVPVGVVGEMCIGGIGVSRGYINLPDLTAQRFVPDPFSPEPGARMFRTGDLGRLLPDGNFEILGRMDNQVKLKGYRIELEEVAAAMMRHPRVSAAAAVVKDKTYLVGFVVPADVDHDELRDVVAAALPAYMVPAVFVGLAVMPTNTNGKTDKKALAAMHVEIAVDALQTDTERALAAVWSQVLGVHVADIGRATSFFALGGDSISAIKAAAAMQHAGISITVPQLFKAQTVARVAVLADAADAHHGQRSATEWPAAVLSDETLAELATVGTFEDAYPATPLQAGMVAATMQDARAYVNQVPLRATRTVSLESLRGAMRAVVQHHAILRTSFVSTVAGGIVQVVRASADAAECVAVTAPLAQHLAADKARGFSLADASWIRATLVCDLMRCFWDVDDRRHSGLYLHVVVTIHHALYDGWSLPMIMRDLAAALDGRHALEPRPAFRTVVDFIAAQDAAATEAFWTQQLVGLEPAQPLSLGHSARTGDEDAPLAQACSTPMAELQRAAQRTGVTVAVVLKAAWAATLRKFTRSHDVVFGEVLANRDIAVAGADRIVGPLLNTVPCRVVLDDTARAADLVASLQAQHGAVLSHSHAALVDVQRWAGVRGDGKLFNTLFVYENMDLSVEQSSFEHVSDNEMSTNRSTDFDLILFPSEMHVYFDVQFDRSHLSWSHAASILAEFDFGVQQLVSALSDKATVESLWTLSPAQQAQIAWFSHGERVPLPFSLVHHGFEARAKQHPDWRAVEHGDAHLSYGDLDACGSALAAALASHGVQRGSHVAVVMQRSIEFVVALVGVLKAGATIVPVDSSFPADRIQFMLDDASVCAIVTTASEAGRIAQLSVGDRAVVVADARALLASGVSFTPAAQHTATGDDDAFIVYMSGSTGKPKGVPVPHKGAANVAITRGNRFGCFESARMAQFMAIGFDGCQWETWSALSHGATLVLREQDTFRTVASVTSLFITPTGLSQMGQPESLPNLVQITVGGEACPTELKDLWAPHVRFNNAYGPTEISFISHITPVTNSDKISLGAPIPNMSCYILDSCGWSVPIGVVGEMHIGGIGVSRGYINLPNLTAQRFVPDPFSPEPGARMFRTGDLGRLLPDGNFEILGRMDNQVKLKGYRIELDEVAAAMMRHPRVSAAAAVVKDKTHLVGFVVPADVDHDELRDVVAAALPAYMVPAVFVGLAVMPTNTNGKTDKKALAAMHVEIAVDKLQTDTERALAAVWSQVLGVHVADIGRATSFFVLGGDSISAIRLLKAIQQQFAVLTMSHTVILKHPQLARMAAAIHAIQHPDAPAETLSSFDDVGKIASVPTLQPTVRIACFHGQGSNTIHMEHQLSAVKAALGETAKFVFIQAPHAAKSSYLSKFYKGMDWFEWLLDDSQSQTDVDTLITYVTQQLEQIGHVDVLLGFSQGAMVVEMLDRLAQAGSIKQTWRLSVLCSGIALSSWQLPSSLAASTPHSMPSIHIFGTNEHKAFQTQLPARYAADKRVVIKHAAGHDIPHDDEFGRRVADAIWDVMDSQVATGTIVSKKRYQKSATKSLLSRQLSCFQ